MHYSTKLKTEIKEKQTQLERADQMIIAFRRHLSSSKFHQDTTIQVSDVHNWLDLVRDEIRATSLLNEEQ